MSGNPPYGPDHDPWKSLDGNTSRVREALENQREWIHNRQNVVGSGIGPKIVGGERTNQLSVIVYVKNKLPPGQLPQQAKVPQFIRGQPTDVQESGEFTAQTSINGRWKRHRPMFGGTSIGRETTNSAASSSGALLDSTGSPVMLTNRHAVTSGATDNTVGEGVVQPGNADYDGTPGTIATVKQLGAWDTTVTTNTVDTALLDIQPSASTVTFQEVDRFERTSLGEAWTGITNASITADAGWRGDTGLNMPARERWIRSHSGLVNYPHAGGGPAGDGKFEIAIRLANAGGTSHISRFAFGLSPDNSQGYRLEFADVDKVALRAPRESDGRWREILPLHLPTGSYDGSYDALIVRVHEWRDTGSGNYFDIEVLDGSWSDGGVAKSLARDQVTHTEANRRTSGGIGVWTNDSTQFQLDEIILGHSNDLYDPADYGEGSGADFGNVSSAVVGLGQMDTAGGSVPDATGHYVKSGRTTGLTSSPLTGTNISAPITYNSGTADEFTIDFTGLHSYEDLSEPGDSGSVIAQFNPSALTHQPVSLLFAGSTTRTLGIPWSAVEAEHGVLDTASYNPTVEPRTADQRQNEVVPLARSNNQNGEVPVLATNAAGGGTDTTTITARNMSAATPEVISEVSATLTWPEPTVKYLQVSQYLDPGTYDIEFSVAGGDATTHSISVDAAGKGELVGRVQDMNGGAISGATVTIEETGGQYTTGSDGYFQEWLTPGEYTVLVTATGYVDHRYTIDVPGSEKTEIDILMSSNTSGYIESWSSITDSLGQTADPALIHGNYDIAIRAPGHEIYHDSFSHDSSVSERTFDLTSTEQTYYTLTVTVLDGAGNAIQGATVSTRRGSATTNSQGVADLSLPSGDYTVRAEKSGYEAAEKTVTISGANARTTITITETEEPDQPPEEPEPVPEPGPGISLPDQPAYIEVAPLDSTATSEFQIPILVSNTGGNAGSAKVRLETASGSSVDSRFVTLDPLSQQIIWMSVRRLSGSGASASLMVSTRDDSDAFDLDLPPEPEIPVSPGRAMTMGRIRGATMAGELGGSLGREMERLPASEPDIARIENGYAITLIAPDGERRHIEDVIGSSVTPRREHTQLSTWSAEVPADDSIEQWTINTRAIITFDERIIYRGFVTAASTTRETTTLEGTGPGGELTDGSVEKEIKRMIDWRAVETMTDDLAPDWDWHVVRPESRESVFVRDERFSGTPLECIKQLHDDYGMRFLIDQRGWRQAVSFPPGGISAAAEFIDIDNIEQKPSSEGYANAVEVKGGHNEAGKRVTARHEDTDEIRRLMNEQGISRSEATIVHPVRDRNIETRKQAKDRAKAETRELVQNRELGGSFDVPASVLNPGVSYPMPWNDNQMPGVYTATVGEGAIDLPTDFPTQNRESGAIAVWAHGTWTEAADRSPLYGAWDSAGYGFSAQVQTTGIATFLMRDTNGRANVVNISSSEVPDNEPLLFVFDWQYDPDSAFTTIRAGVGGPTSSPISLRTDSFGGRPRRIDPDDNFHLLRTASHYLPERAAVADVKMWAKPQSEANYNRLAEGGDIPATDLLSHYSLEEGPDQSGNDVFDVVGGKHGQNNGIRYIGDPRTLHSVKYDGRTATLEFARDLDEWNVVEEVMRDVERMQR